MYCGPEHDMGDLDLLSAHLYSNPGGNPLPGPSSTYPTSQIISQIKRISLKKSTATNTILKNGLLLIKRRSESKLPTYCLLQAIRWNLLREVTWLQLHLHVHNEKLKCEIYLNLLCTPLTDHISASQRFHCIVTKLGSFRSWCMIFHLTSAASSSSIKPSKHFVPKK